MSDPRFLKTGFDDFLSHLVEECGEILVVAGKTQLWGRDSTNTLFPEAEQETNLARLRRKMTDLRQALDSLDVAIQADRRVEATNHLVGEVRSIENAKHDPLGDVARLDGLRTAAPSTTRAPAAGEPWEWNRVNNVDEMEAFFLSRLPTIREAAKDRGYAIGLHGSCRRDFDLMAVPWSGDRSSKDELAGAIQLAACGIRHAEYRWEEKPCGRWAVSMPICWPEWRSDALSLGCIDLSVAAPPPVDAVAIVTDADRAAVTEEMVHVAVHSYWGKQAAHNHYPHMKRALLAALAGRASRERHD